jgi:hypothetical protein
MYRAPLKTNYGLLYDKPVGISTENVAQGKEISRMAQMWHKRLLNETENNGKMNERRGFYGTFI